MTNRLRTSLFLLVLLMSPLLVFSQTYNDGPIQLKVWLGDIKIQYSTPQPSDLTLNIGSFSLPGSLSTDELTFFLWCRDNSNVSGLPWQGGNGHTADLPMTGGAGITSNYSDTLFNHTYTAASVPKFFDIRLKAWEDDVPTDFAPLSGVTPCGSSGSRLTYEPSVCCLNLFGCVFTEGDDYLCDADPFKTNMDYRLGNPCEYYTHGYVSGSGCSNNFYQPQINSFWRYTKGTSCGDAIDLGTLTAGTTLSHLNSTACYGNTFATSPGNDVTYKFTISAATGVDISLCDSRTNFNTAMYLLKSNCTVDTININGCANHSRIRKSLCTPGTYYVVVDGQTASDNGLFYLTINTDTSFTFAATIGTTNVSCFGQSDGALVANVSGGVLPFNFGWSNSLPNNDTVTGLAAGSYSLTVTDASNCTALAQATITQPAQNSVTIATTPVSCGNSNDGSATATPVGGTPPYSYAWNSNPAQTSQTAVLLPAGTYSVTVTDFKGCTATASKTITPSTIVQITTDNVTNVNCFGAANGSISQTVSGGQAPYTHIWTGGLPSVEDQINLGPGQYRDSVTDANGCSRTITYNITSPDLLDVTVQAIINATCSNNSDGGINIATIGGTQPYAFAWSDGSHLTSLFNVRPGSYSVTVTDAHGCTDTTSGQVIFNGTPISSSIAHTDANCLTGVTGTANLTVTGGAGSYTYYWSNFANTQNVTGLKSGSYSVVITDANGCSKIDTVTIAELAPGGKCDTTTGRDTIIITDTTHHVNNGAYVMIPNAFSPNNDGQNDLFQFYINKTNTVEVSIFNRQGAEVYHNANQANGDGWDGKFAGKEAPAGTYVYMVNIHYNDGTTEQKTGSIVLLR